MGGRGTLHRFAVELDHQPSGARAVLEYTVMGHPSETDERLVLRALAYCIEYGDGIAFGPPLCREDEPALGRPDAHGRYDPWIEFGEPDPDRVRRALSRTDRMVVVTSAPARPWLLKMREFRWPKKARVELLEVEPAFVRALTKSLDRSNRWAVRVESESVAVGAASGALRREILATEKR
jgi:uncharacterized protein YaeQ